MSDLKLKQGKERATRVLPTPVIIDPLMSPAQICAALSIGRSKLYQLIATGQFPRGVESPLGDPRWRASTVQEWIQRHFGSGGGPHVDGRA